MSRNLGIKGGTTDKAFQALQVQCFLWEGGAPSAVDIMGLWPLKERKTQNVLIGLLKKKKKKGIQLPAIFALPPDNRRLPENQTDGFTSVRKRSAVFHTDTISCNELN